MSFVLAMSPIRNSEELNGLTRLCWQGERVSQRGWARRARHCDCGPRTSSGCRREELVTTRDGASWREKRALWDMKPFKAPGPDGFNAYFYQSNWSKIMPAVMEYMRRVFTSLGAIEGVNRTLLVLIPKTKNPTFVHQFRPISLCNVNYKLVTKTIANRLKHLMPEILGPFQSSFVPGRHIQDNIIVAQEMIHSMRRMKGKRGFMAIKIDLEKAYDRQHWLFISDTLQATGIPDNLHRIIMACISTPSIQILWNGGNTEEFRSSRGIRQVLYRQLYLSCALRDYHT